MYGKIDREIINRLVAISGENNVLTCREEICGYAHDEYVCQPEGCAPEVVVRPGNVEEVSAILKLASEHRIPVTPRGGGTGLAGGCVPVHGGIVLTVQRMNRLIELDLTILNDAQPWAGSCTCRGLPVSSGGDGRRG